MQKIAILYDASQAVLSTFDLDEVLSRILCIMRDYFHLHHVAILPLRGPAGNPSGLQVAQGTSALAGMGEVRCKSPMKSASVSRSAPF